jgi:DNA-directed RNA polymerase subunit M
MRFCEECGSLLSTDWKNHHYICSRCGTTEKLLEDITYTNQNLYNSKIVVIGKNEKKLSPLPQTNIFCPKCENNKAYWWMVQTRSMDESSTQFYRCTKCGYTWREYS